MNALKGQQDTCEECPNKKALELVALQYKSHHPQWWVVDGTVVIPIWVQERLRGEFHRVDETVSERSALDRLDPPFG